MKKNTFKPASFLCYVLTLVAFFFGGMYLAAITGAAEGQGLAGGAIVLFYGLVTALIALVLAVVLATKASLKTIKLVNVILAILVLVITVVIVCKVIAKSDDPAPQPEREMQPTQAVPS